MTTSRTCWLEARVRWGLGLFVFPWLELAAADSPEQGGAIDSRLPTCLWYG